MVRKSDASAAAARGARALLAIAAFIALLWIKTQGSQTVRDIAAYLLFLGAICAVIFYCVRFLMAYRGHHSPADGRIIVARARSRRWFYVGIACIGVGSAAVAAVLLTLIEDIQHF